MAKGYLIGVIENIRDLDGLMAYRQAAIPTILPYQARPLVMADNIESVEGKLPAASLLVMEFESVDAARAWYESADYQAVAPLRRNATEGTLFITEGFALPA